jgi:hypothetical protein
LSRLVEADHVHQSESVTSPAGNRTQARTAPRRRRLGSASLRGGGVDGNEQLTALNGVLLLVLFAVLGLTIVQIGQLMWLHLFLGLLLLGPVLLKMASTGYRFLRYYTRDSVYVAKGPPMIALRLMGPVVVATTVAVFVSGIVLMLVGPANRSTSLLIHKVTFIVWIVFMALHVLAHLPAVGHALGRLRIGGEREGSAGSAAATLSSAGSGAAGRWIALTGALVGGVVLAILLLPDFGVWTAAGAFAHHHHELH